MARARSGQLSRTAREPSVAAVVLGALIPDP